MHIRLTPFRQSLQLTPAHLPPFKGNTISPGWGWGCCCVFSGVGVWLAGLYKMAYTLQMTEKEKLVGSVGVGWAVKR